MDTEFAVERAVVIPVSDTVILPGVSTIFHLSQPSGALLRALREGEVKAAAVPLRHAVEDRNTEDDDFFRLGVMFDVKSVEEDEDGAVLRGKAGPRTAVSAFYRENGVLYADVSENPDTADMDEKSQLDMLDYQKRIVREISSRFRGGEQYMKPVEEIRDINSFISYLSRFMPLSPEERYEFLKTDSTRERGLRFMDALLKQRESIELNMELNEKLSDEANKYYRRQVLQEQLKAIKAELGEDEGEADDEGVKDYAARIEEAGMPENIKKAALAEVKKLSSMGQGGAEENVVRNYLEFMLSLPWKKEESGPVDLNAARKILNDQHYGLDKVKERIIQHLAVMQLKKDNKGSILLLVGPPGTGKTSLGKSIAEALGRKYVRLSLGGIRDEAEIRGHRRTYVGAMPGRILQSIKNAGTTNPVMVLDEVDKLMTGGFSGDPASALLEVLDPEQNNSFEDHYLDQPYDLSDVFFIATANSLDTIPGPLLDRMEIIQISGYTEEEKFHIGREHLLPDVLSDHGLTPEQLAIDDETLRKIIADYTLEAGVRGLKKQLAAIARWASEKIVSNEAELPVTVHTSDLEELLGRQVSRHDRAQQDNPPGVVTGLAWTPVGGEILFIEATDMPGSGEVTLTGQLGDVMKESARISLSLLKSRLPMSAVDFKQRDLHIHVPSGSVPKDGPSAGITLFTALASLFTGVKVDPRLAMTGEITLRGAVLPIGGLKEKLLGARRAGIKKVLIPKENVIDLKDVPDAVKQDIEIIPVETVEDVLRETLGIDLPRIEHVLMFAKTPEGRRISA
jgi:ATP-dependent Lon protease